MKVILKGTEEQFNNLQTLMEYGDNDLPEIDQIKLIRVNDNNNLVYTIPSEMSLDRAKALLTIAKEDWESPLHPKAVTFLESNGINRFYINGLFI